MSISKPSPEGCADKPSQRGGGEQRASGEGAAGEERRGEQRHARHLRCEAYLQAHLAGRETSPLIALSERCPQLRTIGLAAHRRCDGAARARAARERRARRQRRGVERLRQQRVQAKGDESGSNDAEERGAWAIGLDRIASERGADGDAERADGLLRGGQLATVLGRAGCQVGHISAFAALRNAPAGPKPEPREHEHRKLSSERGGEVAQRDEAHSGHHRRLAGFVREASRWACEDQQRNRRRADDYPVGGVREPEALLCEQGQRGDHGAHAYE